MNKYIFKKKLNIILASLVDFIGYRFFINKPIKTLEYKKILVIRLDQLGDIVSTIPVYSQIKSTYKNSDIYVLTTKQGSDLLKNNPHIKDIITFNCPWHGNGKFSLNEINKVRTVIKNEKFDCALELKGDLRDIVFLRSCSIKNIIGYGSTGGGFLLSNEILFDKSLNNVNRNLALLKGIGINPIFNEKPVINYENSEENIFLNNKPINNRKIVAFHPFAGTRAKMWPIERFKELITKCRNNLNIYSILIGKDLLADSGSIADLSLLGKTNIAQLISVLKNVDLLITNDSGPAHVASALGTPVLIIWGGTSDPRIWKPLGENVTIMHKPIECMLCEKKECSEITCLNDISVDEVYKSINLLINK
ncbi:MAG: hypothetical protein A2252_08380 [Elusimicrobia bacterium RIFOXYA2_FULL_39_19]|nr:MAG: hypothetical protein A2252_08380 [Elusimicrobia bacterium RIFOXYA2_FULL_39_19]